MPELPEVEVVKKSLKKEINNLTIKKVKINDGNLRYKVKKRDINKIVGSKILTIKRRSKYLLIYFNNDYVMIVHLGMTGKFFIESKEKIKKTSFYYEIKENNQKHNRLIFKLKRDLNLIYNDVRKFGFIKIISLSKIKDDKHLKILGPEPLDKNYNLRYFKNYLIGRKRTIKDLLMDQKFVSGLGNIYVNEILFFCKISPIKKINKLKIKDIKNIFDKY